MNRRNTVGRSAGLIVASFLQFHNASAENIPASVYQRYMEAGNKFIASITWPSNAEKLGFKHLALGDNFDFSGPLIYSYVHDHQDAPNNAQPLLCQYKGEWYAAPVVECSVIFWVGNSYPEELMELKTAFGEYVKVKVGVFLNKTLSFEEINNRQFGQGRISSIKITNEKPLATYNKNAIDYFTDKLKVAPQTAATYQNPQQLYSKSCLTSTQKLENKPRQSWTVAEEKEAKKCEAEAMLAFLSGKANTVRTQVYSWTSSQKEYVAFLLSREVAVNANGTNLLSAQKTEITIKLGNIKSAEEAYHAELTKITAEWRGSANNSRKGDF